MGLGPDAFHAGAWNVGKSKGKKKKDDEDEMTGCWMKFRLMGGCVSSRTKVDSSTSGTSTQDGIIYFPLSFVSFLYVFLIPFLNFYGLICGLDFD